jgi:mRNA interferase RelE/StbE
MTYDIQFTGSAEKEMRKMPQAMQKRIQPSILALGENPLPSGCKKVRGYDNYFRIRIGDYRVVYALEQKIRIVTIIRIRHRREAYRFL